MDTRNALPVGVSLALTVMTAPIARTHYVACRRSGHVATNCDVLAIALFIEKYKRDLLDDVKDRIETDWVAHWRLALGNPTKKPRRVMKTYLDLLDITMDDLDDQMCWDCWAEGNDIIFVAADTPSE